MKKIFIVLASLLFTVSAFAQQDLLMTQQFFSRINKNPACIGNFEQIDAFLLGRFQWLDIKDSPKSGIFNVQTFKTDLNSGFGFTMSYDDIGPAKGSFNPKAVYAYVLRLREDMVLSTQVNTQLRIKQRLQRTMILSMTERVVYTQMLILVLNSLIQNICLESLQHIF